MACLLLNRPHCTGQKSKHNLCFGHQLSAPLHTELNGVLRLNRDHPVIYLPVCRMRHVHNDCVPKQVIVDGVLMSVYGAFYI